MPACLPDRTFINIRGLLVNKITAIVSYSWLDVDFYIVRWGSQQLNIILAKTRPHETLNAEMLRLLKVSLRTIICASTTYRWHQSIIIVKGRNPTIFIFKSIFLIQRNAGRKSFPVTDWFWLRGRRSSNRCFLAKHFRKVKTEKSSLTTFRTVISTLSKVLDMQKFKQKFTNYAVIIEDISFTKLNIRDIHFD